MSSSCTHDLSGRVAIVTGANNPLGLGRAIAVALAEAGADLFVTYYRQEVDVADPDAAPGEAYYMAQQSHHCSSAIEAIQRFGRRVEAWEVDLADPAAVPELFDRAEAALGPVDILVNNAAHCVTDTFRPGGSEAAWGVASGRISAETIDRHFAVNTRTPALAMAEMGRRHHEAGRSWGRIINISTDAASQFPGETSYGASKYALEAYSKSAATELGGLGITVNVISPGPIQTGYIPAELEQELSVHTPLGGVGRPGDVADVAVFLASDAARWLTGQIIYVGGGHRMPG
ncbi:MAG: SDR family oxidoreductase [Armatimonadia bacterium]|nr:SDR family oxidoreductase [Armatimonadia bacterium]